MINLLSQTQKEEMRQEMYLRLAFILSTLIFLFLVCLSLLFLAIRVYLAGEIQAQEILIDIESSQFGEHEEAQVALEALNKDIERTAAVYERQVPVSLIVERLALAMQPELYMISFAYAFSEGGESNRGAQAARSSVSLSGVAPTRGGFLSFIDALERDPIFSSVSFPTSNLTTVPGDPTVRFSVTAEINAKELRQDE